MINVGKPTLIKMGFLLGGLVAILAVSVACSSDSPTPATAPAQPAAAAAPAAAEQAPVVIVPGAPTAIPARATATRVVPTATPVAKGGPKYGGILRNAKPLGRLDSLDGHINRRYEGLEAMFAIYNNIVQIAPDGTIAPDLAKSWEISDDGMSITFNLQSGVKFHDGTSMDASSLKWNIERILDPEAGSSQRGVIGPYIANAEVIDKNTFKLNLSEPFRPLLAVLGERSGYVLSPTAVQTMGQKFEVSPVGTGPFKLTKWEPKGDIYLEKNDNYWESGKPYLDGMHFQNLTDPDVRLAMIRTGETDVMHEVEPTQIALVENDPTIQIREFSGGQTWGFRFVIQPPYDNVALRQALAYATDRVTFNQVFYEGRARDAYVAGTMSWEYNPDLKPMKYDVAKAKAKFAEAGYSSSSTLPLWCRGNNIELLRCELYQAALLESGINMELITLPSSDWWISFRPDYKDRNLFGMYWFNPRGDPHQSPQRVFHTNGGSNRMDYSNAEVDSLINEAAKIYDIAKAKSMYDRMNEIIAQEDPAMVFTSNPIAYTLLGSHVKNFEFVPDYFPRVRELWMEK